MAVRRLADEQPETFAFTAENEAWARGKIADYPQGRQASAVIPILWRAQEQMGGWLPEPAIRLVADMLDMPYIRVFEVATFYTMFQLKPVGTVAHINVCGTTPCMLRGSEDLIAVCKSRIAGRPFELSADGRFSWEEVECAGACVNAPMVQIGADTFEDLTPETFAALLDALEAGNAPAPGPQSARKASEPLPGATTLRAEDVSAAPSAPPAPDNDTQTVVEPDAPAAANEQAAQPDPAGRPEVAAARAEPPAKSHEPPAEATAEPPAEATAEPPAKSDEPPAPDGEAASRADAAGRRPKAVSRETVEADDLKRISGIGKVIEGTLHGLGIFTFDQIAAWDEANKEWVNAYLAFKGRIDREKWVEQATDIVNERGGAS
ncbi:MAG: NADH-quinone oxidoreductase subunit NuoE [Pseudomonadota bacterium]